MKCKYCGEEFTKTHNRQMYCSDHCRKSAKKEQNRNGFHKWYHKNKHRLSEKKRFGLGSGKLGAHAHSDVDKEFEVIQKEFARLRLR